MKLIVGFSRLKTWRRCHRLYNYKYVQGLARKRPPVPLIRGTILHALLDAQALKKSTTQVLQKYRKEFGKLFLEQREEYGDLIGDCERIFNNYNRHYAAEAPKYEVIGSEIELKVDLGGGVEFQGHIDKIWKDKQRRRWVVDHKCLAIETRVDTPDGRREIGSLSKGDRVFSPEGKPIRVVSVDRKKAATFDLVLKNGKVLRATAEHRWPIQYRGKLLLKTTQELREMLQRGRKRGVRLLPGSAIPFPPADFKVHPYVIGALIGDGALQQGLRFCNGHFPTVVRFNSRLPADASITALARPDWKTPSYYIRSALLRKEIRRLGLAVHGLKKFIPPEYLQGSIEQRRSLLAGLLDTDGTVYCGHPLYVTSSKRLALDVIALVESLGGVTSSLRCQKAPRSQSGPGQPSWRVSMQFSPEFGVAFEHEEKVKKSRESKLAWGNALRIRSIRPAGEHAVADIEVDSADHLFLAEGIQTHNSHKNIPGDEQRFSDLQTVFYTWAWNQLHPKEKVDGVIWDYLRTKTPSVPEVLKNGTLSKRENIDTDFATAAEAVTNHLKNLPPGIVDKASNYSDWLSMIKAKENRFFKRVFLPSPPKMLVEQVVDDMRTTAFQILKFPDAAERNMTRDCSWCEFYGLCNAELRGQDADYLRKTEFTINQELLNGDQEDDD